MNHVVLLALSRWAHFSWLPSGERALTERSLANANADLLARYPLLVTMRTKPAMPPFATLPRPACAKVLRVAAALAHARLLRKIVVAKDQKLFAARIAPQVLHVIQRDQRAGQEDRYEVESLNVMDRKDMTAVGLRMALCATHDPALRLLIELRLPRVVVQRMARFELCDMPAKSALALLDDAYALAGGRAC